MWGALAAESADIEALAAFPALRRAYAEGLVDPEVIDTSELDDVEAARFGPYASNRRAEELAALAEAGEFDEDAPIEPYRALGEDWTKRAVPLW